MSSILDRDEKKNGRAFEASESDCRRIQKKTKKSKAYPKVMHFARNQFHATSEFQKKYNLWTMSFNASSST